jgi:hypothetical protein
VAGCQYVVRWLARWNSPSRLNSSEMLGKAASGAKNSCREKSSAVTTVAVTVATTAHSMLVYRPLNRPQNNSPFIFAFVLFAVALLAWLARLVEDRRRGVSALAPLFLVCIGMLLSSCGSGEAGGGVGGGANPGTPTGSYTLKVTGTFNSGSTTLTHNTNLTLVVQ